MLGAGKIFVGDMLSQRDASDAAKHQVLEHIWLRSDSTPDRWVIYEFSDEQYIYDHAGTWYISSLETERQRDGRVATEVVLNEPMRGLAPLPPDLLRPDLLIPQAFEADPENCVVLQLTAVTGLPRAEVIAGLQPHEPEWRTRGVSAKAIVAFCTERALPCYVCYGGRVTHAYRPEAPKHSRGIAFSFADGHAWFYSSTYAISHLATRDVELPPMQKLQMEERERKVDASSWQPWAGQFDQPGDYFTECIEEARRQFLVRGLNPHVTLASRTSIARLTLRLASGDEEGAAVRVHSWPRHATEMKEWVARLAREHELPLTWQGEGIGVMALKILTAFLLQRARVRPPAALQAQIAASQENRCALCGGLCEENREFDHIVPLRDQASPQVFQMLCAECHKTKTQLEPRSSRDPLASVFSKSTWEAYVEAPQLPPLTFNVNVPHPKAGPAYEVDVIRCRRNALLHSAHPFPLFCVLDTIQPAEQRLYDLQYIDAGPAASKPGLLLRNAPYTGPRWYPRIAAEFLLHHGIVAWSDFKWGLDATGHLPNTAFEKALLAMDKAWGDNRDLAKLAVNAALGIMGSPRATTYRLKSGVVPEGTLGAIKVITQFDAQTSVVDWIGRRRCSRTRATGPSTTWPSSRSTSGWRR